MLCAPFSALIVCFLLITDPPTKEESGYGTGFNWRRVGGRWRRRFRAAVPLLDLAAATLGMAHVVAVLFWANYNLAWRMLATMPITGG